MTNLALHRPFAAAIVVGTALAAGPAASIEFADRTAEMGIQQGHSGYFLITGQAWGDYDGDGRVDLYLTDSGGPNTLYRNTGSGFEVAGWNAQVALPGHVSGGATWADYDNDGRDDLFVVGLGWPRLFRNTAAGFVDVSTAMGLDDDGMGESAAWGDFDADGWLDLYIVHWFYDEDETDPRAQDRLYRNLGGQGFEDVSHLLDEGRMSGPGFAAAFTDYDHDGDADLYVVNDKHWGNLLWRNDGAGCGGWCFTDVSLATGTHRPAFSMGIAVDDYDLDGDFDFFYSSIAELILLHNPTREGGTTWTDVSSAMQCTGDVIGWGVIFEDFDNDVDFDLYAATVESSPSANDRVYSNEYPAPFYDISATAGASDPFMTIGAARADYDRDGRMDLVVGNYDIGYRLMRNVTPAAGGWLQVALVGGGPINRNAAGSRVILTLDDGREIHRELRIGESIGSSHERIVHFGLGAHQPLGLRIEWPDGEVTTVETLPTDARVEFSYPLAFVLFADGFEAAP